MNWVTRYRLKLYVRNSIWIFPVLSIAAALLAVALLNRIDFALDWKMNLNPDTARAVTGTIASSMFTLVVVASSAILVVVQLASAQMTPRLIALPWEPLAVAALNQAPGQAAAAPFVTVLGHMFGSDPRAASIALPVCPLHEMYALPAQRYIEARGGEVIAGAFKQQHQDNLRAAHPDGPRDAQFGAALGGQ